MHVKMNLNDGDPRLLKTVLVCFMEVQARTQPGELPRAVPRHPLRLPPETLRRNDAGMLPDLGAARGRRRHSTL